MKFFFCVTLAILAGVQALTNEQKEKLNKISQECKNKSGVSQDLIDKARVGDFANEAKLKTQMLCVAKKTGLGTEAGEIDVNVLKTKLKKVTANDEEADKIVQKCGVKKGTPEETAFDAFVCIYKEKPNFSVVD